MPSARPLPTIACRFRWNQSNSRESVGGTSYPRELLRISRMTLETPLMMNWIPMTVEMAPGPAMIGIPSGTTEGSGRRAGLAALVVPAMAVAALFGSTACLEAPPPAFYP